MINKSITYLRAGRLVRGSGVIVGTFEGARGKPGNVKVKPSRPDWGHIIVTPAEIEAGKEKPPLVPRKKKDGEEAPAPREKKPKPPPVPRWKELVGYVRTWEQQGPPVFFPMALVTELADELEAAQTLFSKTA